jgi:hypothetical protein
MQVVNALIGDRGLELIVFQGAHGAGDSPWPPPRCVALCGICSARIDSGFEQACSTAARSRLISARAKK